MAWVLVCKPIRAPFRDGTSVLVRNLLQAMPAEVELIYFGDPAAPIRGPSDRVVAATGMRYQPSLSDKARLLGHLLTPSLSRAPLHSFFAATVSLMKIMARACGHDHLAGFDLRDLTTWDRDMAYLTGIAYGGVTPV